MGSRNEKFIDIENEHAASLNSKTIYIFHSKICSVANEKLGTILQKATQNWKYKFIEYTSEWISFQNAYLTWSRKATIFRLLLFAVVASLKLLIEEKSQNDPDSHCQSWINPLYGVPKHYWGYYSEIFYIAWDKLQL